MRLVDDERVAPNALGVGSIEELLRYVEAKYVDPVDRDSLVDAAITSVLGELDPYSAYVPPAGVAAHHARLAGTTEGAGVELGLVEDSVAVLRVLPGSPADVAGVLAGDRVLRVGDTALGGAGYELAELAKALEANAEGPLRLELYRRGAGVLAPIAVSRRTLAVPSVGEGRLLGADVAYVPVYQFADSTYFEYMRRLERLVEGEGARHLVLDLRGNGGGYLREAVRLLGQFFPEAGTLLVYTEGAHAPRREYSSSGRVLFPVERVAVLVDGGSASASEVVAGALQDWDRATVVGRPTHGKGLVQEAFELKDGGLLHLTVSRYYTPSGRSIQRAYGAGGGRPRAAFRTAAGREVLDGGGIDPDILVTASDTYLSGSRRRDRSATQLLADPDIAAAVAAIREQR